MNDKHEFEYNIYESRKKRKKKLLALLFVIVLLGIGYAFLQTFLNISGTATIKGNTWNIYWDRNTLDPIISEGVSVTLAPQVEANNTSITFNITLNKPGDYVMFTVDAHNEGSIDAMVNSTFLKVNNNDEIPNYLDYSVSHLDDVPIEKGQLLKSFSSETYKVMIAFKKSVTSETLPSGEQNLTLTFGVDYVQADASSASTNSYTVYNVSSTRFTIGEPVPGNVTTYDNYQEAIDAFANPIFLKHIIENGIVKTASIGMVSDGEVYLFDISDSGGDSVSIIDGLNDAFGKDNCSDDELYGSYRCEYDLFSARYDYNDDYLTIDYKRSQCCEIDVNKAYCGK